MNHVSQWMVKDVKTALPSNTVLEACSIMKAHGIGCVIVVDNNKPVGMFTERDLVTRVGAEGKDVSKTLLRDVMTSELITVPTTANCEQVYSLMRARQIRHLPIVENETLMGIISIRDLVRFHMQSVEKTIVDLSSELSFIRGILDQSGEERVKTLYFETKKLETLVVKDSLTGLYNYRYFEEVIAAEASRAKKYNYPLSLLFLDIDNFKQYNDTNGHDEGNMLLKQLSDLLRKTSRTTRLLNPLQEAKSNDIVARYGGEEFVIILPETKKDGAYVKANRIWADVRAFPFPHAEKQPGGHVTVSIGVAELPLDGDTWEDLLRKADEALYKAKYAGKDRVV